MSRGRPPGGQTGALPKSQLSLIATARQPGVWAAMLSYFCYCSVENTTLLWGASYFVTARGFSTVAAAQAASLFVLGITIGRFLCGFASARLSSSALILGGGALAALGAAGMGLLPAAFGPAALCVVGLGFAPAYPCMMHETPHRFGAGALAGRYQPADGLGLCRQRVHAAPVWPAGRARGHMAVAGVPCVRHSRLCPPARRTLPAGCAPVRRHRSDGPA